MDVIGFVLLGLVVIGLFIALVSQQDKLENPENTDVVYLDELRKTCILPEEGIYVLRTIRQSGNPQKDDQKFNSSSVAIKKAISTFKRAKIEYAVISKNTDEIFCFSRPYYSHRGVKEGKKVGSIEINRIG